MKVILRKNKTLHTLNLAEEVCIHDASLYELSSITDAILAEEDFFETGILAAFVREKESNQFDKAEDVLASDADALFYKVAKIDGVYSSLGFSRRELRKVYNSL